MMKYKPEKSKPTEKLIMDQTNKQREFIHSIDLKIYKRHGIRVLIIHTVYRFSQFFWLAQYNKYDTEERIKAKTEFENNFYRLINNSFHGKTVQFIRKCLNPDFIDKWDTHRILNWQSNWFFHEKVQEIKKIIYIHSVKEVLNLQSLLTLGFVY